MMSTAHVCQPWIQHAASVTGLTEKEVKVSLLSVLCCSDHFQHGFAINFPFHYLML